MDNFYSAILASIIGGLITGGFMLWQNRNNHKHDLNVIKAEEERQENAVLQAIKTEIKVIWERYDENIKPMVNKLIELSSNNAARFIDFGNINKDEIYLNKLLSYKTSISQDYFTIYNGNSSFIGKIKNDILREKIVSTYTNTKGMVDEILLLGLFQDNLRNSSKEIKKPNSGNIKLISAENDVVERYKDILIEFSKYIIEVKKEQDKLDVQIKELLKLIGDENQDNL